MAPSLAPPPTPANSGIEGACSDAYRHNVPLEPAERTRGTLSRLYRLNTPTVVPTTTRGTLSRICG